MYIGRTSSKKQELTAFIIEKRTAALTAKKSSI
jgi:hypothetical protein